MLWVMPEICRQTHDALEEIIVSRSEMSKTQENLTVEWKDLPWRKLEVRVWKLQKRIFRASQRGDLRAVRRLQKTLMRSWSAKCMAVRKVTQDNQGKKTAGVDGIKSLSPAARLTLISQLKLTGNSKPTRRVWIEKPGKSVPVEQEPTSSASEDVSEPS